VNGLKEGGPVKFKGVEIGTVREVSISISALQDPGDRVRIPVVIAFDKTRLTEEGVKGINFDDPGWIRRGVDLGLRAQLATESLVTGVRYLELDLKPGTPAALVADPTVNYPEIPAMPSFTEQVPDKITDLVEKLAKVDYENLEKSISSLVDETRKLVGSPELKSAVAQVDDVASNLRQSAIQVRRLSNSLAPDGKIGKSVQKASESAQRLVNPESGLTTQLDATLSEVRAAASSLRELSDQLKRDPGSLLRGPER
jgi:paraquat-inducible protein B